MNKKYLAIITIWIAALVIFATTFSFFPGFIRERGELYTSTEYSKMLLTDEDYENLEIEYDYIQGCSPSQEAREQLLLFINKYCEKKKVTERLDDKIVKDDKRFFYSEEDIHELNNEYQDIVRHRETVSLHVMFLDGMWEKDKDVLGLSYGGNKIVIFKQAVRSISRKSYNLEVSDIERSVIVHEFGHLLSLVGINYRSDHEVDHHHCDLESGPCVMASSVEVNIGSFSQKPPIDLCPLCQKDLEKIKNSDSGEGLEDIITYVMIISEFGITLGLSISLIPERKNKVKYQDSK